MRIHIAYTANTITVRANEHILFKIACALSQQVYMEETGLTTNRHMDTLGIIHRVIEQECDIDFIDQQDGKITQLTYYCFE